ncbi:bifunctional metallophosphatase/5'-nucleotidase [Hamadaea sp. NPDC051192]|uniref:bifunctional metallophosphatase/5'-nucleotidase n=1 Tax=Hamadaea sp. NPDC051192 TaxID=3154940 RepID=UPI003433A1A1
MSSTRRPSRFALVRLSAVPALALAVVLALPLADAGRTDRAGASGWTPLSPVSVTYDKKVPPGRTAHGNLLSFNDFHGAIDAPTGSGGLINGTPAGGVEFLTTWVKKLRAEAEASGERSLTVAAGDLIGASPLVSAGFHDEPTIELMDNLGLDVASVGNHEFDEGTDELLRMQNGGCHPVDGCLDGDGFAGADFEYLAANAIVKDTGKSLLPSVTVKNFQGVRVGFVGMTLQNTAGIVDPAGISSIEFKNEVETANKQAALLKRAGVRAVVLLIHEGGQQNAPAPLDISGCAAFAGAITPIVAGLDPAFGLVVSGHTHRYYSCALPNSAGTPIAVTSAGSNGQLVTDISFTLDKKTEQFTSVEAHNVIVENGVRNADGSWQIDANGVPVRNEALKDAAARTIADKYRTKIQPIANRVVGKVTADITRTAVAGGESPLGDVIADAQLAYTQSAGAQIALMNPGGIRDNLVYSASTGGEAAGEITYGECFIVQPFNNTLVTKTMTGDELRWALEQQFTGFEGQSSTKILQVSSGFTYTYSASAALGGKISNLALNGVAIDPAATFRVTMNGFLDGGGDFTAYNSDGTVKNPSRLNVGTDKIVHPGFDIDALVAYFGAHSQVAPGTADRITRAA